MFTRELKLPFRMYEKKADRAVEDTYVVAAIGERGSYENLYPISFSDTTLSWIIRFKPSALNAPVDVSEWKIITDAGLFADLISLKSLLGYTKVADGYEYVSFNAQPLVVNGLPIAMPCNSYWLEVVVNGNRYYSDVFEVRESPCAIGSAEKPYYWLKFNNDLLPSTGCDLPPIVYENGFYNHILLDEDVETLLPVISADNKENSNKDSIDTTQRLQERLTTKISCHVKLAESLIVMAMHKNIWLTAKQNNRAIKLSKIEVSAEDKFEDNSTIATLTLQLDNEYSTEYCCDQISKEPSCGAGFSGISRVVAGDIYNKIEIAYILNKPASKIRVLCSQRPASSPSIAPIEVLANGQNIIITTILSDGEYSFLATPYCDVLGNTLEGIPYLLTFTVNGSPYVA
jgi:hypothetical protein